MPWPTDEDIQMKIYGRGLVPYREPPSIPLHVERASGLPDRNYHFRDFDDDCFAANIEVLPVLQVKIPSQTSVLVDLFDIVRETCQD
jgi:hypothetical protein